MEKVSNPGTRKNFVGKQFGKLTVIEKIQDHVYSSGKIAARYRCECECGNHIDVKRISLTTKTRPMKQCQKCTKDAKEKIRELKRSEAGAVVEVKNDLVGQVFGRLTVLSRADDYVAPKSGMRYARYLCKCECGNEVEIVANGLRTGKSQSCGCYMVDRIRETCKKYNEYYFKGDTVIGKSSNSDDLFYCDIEDFDKIKDICWRVGKSHKNAHVEGKYLWGHISGKNRPTQMHLFLGFPRHDHINRNGLDNRKANLRPATTVENARNKSRHGNNKSGVSGVFWREDCGTWSAYIGINYKMKYLGHYTKKEDAIVARLRAEKCIYKEFAPQQHLYKQYNIV